MNFYYLASGIIAFMAVIGHFKIGKKLYLNPILSSSIDEIPKKVMQSLFHYASVIQVLSTLVLIGNAFTCSMNDCVINSNATVKFIAFVYGGFAIVQLIIAASAKIDKGIFKLFQWIFWVLIAALAILGTL